MNTRTIQTKIWDDSFFFNLSSEEKLFFIYLFTNMKVTKVGIYELPERFIIFQLGLSKEKIAKYKKKFESDRKYFFFKDWVFINNFHIHNSFNSLPNIVSSFNREFDEIPKEIKDYFFVTLNLKYKKPLREKKAEAVNDTVMDTDTDNSLPPRLPPRLGKQMTEDVDPNDIPF